MGERPLDTPDEYAGRFKIRKRNLLASIDQIS